MAALRAERRRRNTPLLDLLPHTQGEPVWLLHAVHSWRGADTFLLASSFFRINPEWLIKTLEDFRLQEPQQYLPGWSWKVTSEEKVSALFFIWRSIQSMYWSICFSF